MSHVMPSLSPKSEVLHWADSHQNFQGFDLVSLILNGYRALQDCAAGGVVASHTLVDSVMASSMAKLRIDDLREK